MKKLDWLIIRTFLGPFFLTLFIAIFVLVMIFLWRFIEDLASKGLDFVIVMKLLFYASATTIPMALPIAVLLSSIMTLGSFAESLELSAAKASGIGLFRFIRALMVLAVGIGGFAFFFANNMLPIASFKLRQIVTEIGKKMPALDIQEGVFYDGLKDPRGGGFNLMIQEKEADQKTFYGMIVYDHTLNTGGAENLIQASKGDINISDDGNFMILNLYNGVRYSDMNFYTRKQPGTPFSREFFKEQHIIINLGDQVKNNQGNYIGNQYTMMTVGQLNQVRDEMKAEIHENAENFTHTLGKFYSYKPKASSSQGDETMSEITSQIIPKQESVISVTPTVVRDTTIPKRVIAAMNWGQNFFKDYTPQEKNAIKNTALGQLGPIKSSIDQNISTVKSKYSSIVRNRIEFTKKFTLSIACILFFFIGAPLGAIIRKGGLGLPLIVSILIFIVYYVVSTIFEKSVRAGGLDLYGLWISSLILFPFGLFLTLKAGSDSSLFVLSTYTQPFKRIFARRKKA